MILFAHWRQVNPIYRHPKPCTVPIKSVDRPNPIRAHPRKSVVIRVEFTVFKRELSRMATDSRGWFMMPVLPEVARHFR